MKVFYSLIFLVVLSPGMRANAQTLLHYWNFNNSASVNDLLSVSSSTVGTAAINFTKGPGTDSDVIAGTNSDLANNLNARNSDVSGTHLRFNTPIGGNLTLSIPTTGYQNVIVKYNCIRTNQGAGIQKIYYSTDGTNFTYFKDIVPPNGAPGVVQVIDFSSIAETDDKANFKVRLEFEQGAGGVAGNNRIDNLTVEGIALGTVTTFQPGDIVFTGYRSSSDVTDEIQFLTFVDILGGTQINFTDAKYNDLGQCEGGLVWTAPASGIAAMSTVNIVVDASPATTSKGTITGNKFGLSSDGDQVIAYTGPHTNPKYVAAFSSNGWTTASLIACNGSLSKIPGTLTDGQTALNTSTSPGNLSGNSPNGVYNGVHTGTAAELRALILDAANWVITGKNSSAQVWPSWTAAGSATALAFDKKFVSVKEEANEVVIKLKLTNAANASAKLVVKGSPWSTATPNDYTLAASTDLTFTADSPAEKLITIPIANDATKEQDEYFVLSLENASGLTFSGSTYMTVFIKDNDEVAPVASKAIELKYVSSFEPNSASGSTTEIVVHDPVTQRLFMTSAIQDRLDIADFSNPENITLVKSIDMTQYSGGITSVAVKGSIVAVASPNADDQSNGSVVFFTTDGEFKKQVTVGVLPDMITFSPDGTKVMTANEGQPNDAYTSDPEGSVSIIDISGGIDNLDQSKVTTLLFTAFNSQEETLMAAGVRKLKATSTLSQDFEPEYVTMAADSKKAWVTIQESNAIAEVDLETNVITSVWPLGKKDHSIVGNGLDGSDNSGVIAIANWPVKSFYIPDAIANFKINDTNFLITANEGDEKEYAGLNERTTVNDATLDPTVFPNAAVLKETHNIGRLRMTKLSGDTDGDGDNDEINIPGGRSFSIWNADTKTLVSDSGDEFERIIANDADWSAIFNADNEGNALKGRSRAKGPEPEGVTVAKLEDHTYAFIALERVGGVMAYDISTPTKPKFVDYENHRSTTVYPDGDYGPEGIIYISRENSPNGKAYIAVANEISGTVAVYEILKAPKREQTVNFTAVAAKKVGDAVFSLTATSSSALPVTFSTGDDEVTISANQVTILKAGRVTITATQAGDGVFKEATAVQTFCVNPEKPVITINSSNTALQSSATTGNQWFKDGLSLNETGPTLTITSAGNFTVQTKVEECASPISEQFVVVVTGDIPYVTTELTLSPNPAEDKLMIQLPGVGLKTIRIINSNGIEVMSQSTQAENEVIHVGEWSRGLYIVQVRSSIGSHLGKFVRK